MQQTLKNVLFIAQPTNARITKPWTRFYFVQNFIILSLTDNFKVSINPLTLNFFRILLF